MSVFDKEVIECRAFDSAQEIIRALRVTECPWDKRFLRPYQWGFRGQENSDWELVPSALRKGTILGFNQNKYTHISEGLAGCQRQLNGEFIAVKQFLEAADHVGLVVPGDHPFFRTHSGNDRYPIGSVIGTADWPKVEMLELIGMAQHHGVPTRLLDFTFLPLVALYFAASSGIRNFDSLVSTGADSIAVWGVDLDFLDDCNGQLSIVQVPKGRNPFLRAQQGFFVFDPWASHLRDTEELASINRRVDELPWRDEEQVRQVDVRMIKYTAPLNAAEEILHFLSLENVDKPHLMPTFDNVVLSLKRQSCATSGAAQ